MKKGTKLIIAGVTTLIGAVLLSGCTQSFCSNLDTGRMLYAFDPGVTRYEAGTDTIEYSFDETHSYKVTNVTKNYAKYSSETNQFYFNVFSVESDDDKLTYLNSIAASAVTSGYISIGESTVEYFKHFDEYVLKDVLQAATQEEDRAVVELDFSSENDRLQFERDLGYYSYLKFVKDNNSTMWEKWDNYDLMVRTESGVAEDFCPSSDFVKLYKSAMNQYISTFRSCLTTRENRYGSYGYSTNGVYIEAKNWGDGFNKGLFEGLLVYPIGALIDVTAYGFINGGVNAGWAALLSILIVTFVVRGLMLLLTFKSTAASAKMTELQPEIQKIQNKYPNANTSQTEKQRMAEEMNRLYKKNGVNPLSSLLVMLVQFPVFICVWGAFSGSSILSSGSVLGLHLSLTIREVLFNGANWTAAGNFSAITALILFILMAASQTVSMLLPQWFQKKKAKTVGSLGKNPAQTENQNRTKLFTYIMLAMIIFMGFALVSAMGVYWFVGALFSIIQTLITQKVIASKKKKKQ